VGMRGVRLGHARGSRPTGKQFPRDQNEGRPTGARGAQVRQGPKTAPKATVTFGGTRLGDGVRAFGKRPRRTPGSGAEGGGPKTRRRTGRVGWVCVWEGQRVGDKRDRSRRGRESTVSSKGGGRGDVLR